MNYPSANGWENQPSMIFDNQIFHRWLSTDEAASYLGVTSNALRIMVHRNRIKAHKLGSRLKFRLQDLKASIK